MTVLNKLGVEAITNTRVNEDHPLRKDFNVVLDCLPGKVKGPAGYMKGDLAATVEPHTG